jgi:hypothetical protein
MPLMGRNRHVPLGDHGYPVFHRRTERRTMDEFQMAILRDAWDELPPMEKRIVKRSVLDRAKRGGAFQFLRDFIFNSRSREIPGLSDKGRKVASGFAARIYITKYRREASMVNR